MNFAMSLRGSVGPGKARQGPAGHGAVRFGKAWNVALAKGGQQWTR